MKRKFISVLPNGKRNTKNDTYYWGIFLKSNNEIIGTVYLLTECNASKVGTISYCLGYDYWGNGYICESVNAVIDFAFNKIGLTALKLITHKVMFSQQEFCKRPVCKKRALYAKGVKPITATSIALITQF